MDRQIGGWAGEYVVGLRGGDNKKNTEAKNQTERLTTSSLALFSTPHTYTHTNHPTPHPSPLLIETLSHLLVSVLCPTAVPPWGTGAWR